MNEQNLEKHKIRTASKARELGRKGGQASARVRAERKSMRERLLAWGDQTIRNNKGEQLEREDVIALQIANKAASGDLKAARLYAELTGQLVQQIEMNAELAAKRAPVFKGLPDPKND